MSCGLRTSNPDSDILYISFNQDATCISVGTRSGYRVYNCEPFGKCFHDAEGGIGIVQMLFCTSLVALVGAGDQPAFSPRRLRVWNTKTQTAICDLNFVTAILSVQMNRQRLVVILEKKIYIFDLNSMQILETLETSANPQAICMLSASDNGYLCFPSGASPGEMLLYDTNNLSVLNALQAHKAPVVAVAFNQQGTLLATASETGTIIRVFTVPTGIKKQTFRRGSYPARVYSLAFNATSTILCASSSTGTIHIFSLTGAESSTLGSFAAPAAALTDIVEGTRDFAFARLRSCGIPNVCAIQGPIDGETTAQVLVATLDGYFYQYQLDLRLGGECRLERENVLRDSTSEEIEATYLSN